MADELLNRVQTEVEVKCVECGHVGKVFVPLSEGLNVEIKEWGEKLILAAYQLGRADEAAGVHDGDILKAIAEPAPPTGNQGEGSL